MHDSDIFRLKIGTPDKNNHFATLPDGAPGVGVRDLKSYQSRVEGTELT